MSCGQCIRKVLKAAEPLTKHTLAHAHRVTQIVTPSTTHHQHTHTTKTKALQSHDGSHKDISAIHTPLHGQCSEVHATPSGSSSNLRDTKRPGQAALHNESTHLGPTDPCGPPPGPCSSSHPSHTCVLTTDLSQSHTPEHLSPQLTTHQAWLTQRDL